jgi:hypothetical protein
MLFDERNRILFRQNGGKKLGGPLKLQQAHAHRKSLSGKHKGGAPWIVGTF